MINWKEDVSPPYSYLKKKKKKPVYSETQPLLLKYVSSNGYQKWMFGWNVTP